MRSIAALALVLAVGGSTDATERRPRYPRTMTVSATAYCRQGETATGDRARRGIVAADPRVFPIGTRIRISDSRSPYRGTYTVADVGRSVKGRQIDIFVPSCRDAKRFGRRPVRVTVLRKPSPPAHPSTSSG